MYSARRTVTTKSSSNIPIRTTSRSSARADSNEMKGDLIGAGKVVNTVEVASETSKDSGFTESETINGGFVESQVHSGRVSVVSSSQSFTAAELHLELEEDVGENDDFLKEELIHIFERERSTLELYFKNKMDDVLHRFRKNQMEWEEASRAEKAGMENAFTEEKTAMQRSFGEEIAKLTHTFNEERAQLELYYKAQLKELKEQARKEQMETEEKNAREKIELKEKLEVDYQIRLKSEISEGMKGALLEKEELEARVSQEKGEIEREYKLQLTREEAKLQKLSTEMESRFQQERLELEQEFRQKLMQIEEKLHQERELRYEAERQLEQERLQSSSTDSNRNQEIERLKNEIAKLHSELDEKNKSVAVEVQTLEERILQGGREGLSGTLKSDFERLLAEHTMELDMFYQRDKEKLEQSMDQQLQEERAKIRVEMERESQRSKEASLKGNGEMIQAGERLYTQENSNAENETRNSEEVRRSRFGPEFEDKSRRSAANRAGDEANYSGALQQSHSSSGAGLKMEGSDFYYVSPQNEDALRDEINGLRSENEGLKAKVVALEENIELHKKYKTEAQAEMKRLQKEQAEHHTDNDELFKLQMEKDLRDAQTKSRDYERKLKELRAQLKDEERAAMKADRSTRDVETKIKELEKRIRVLEDMAKDADARAKHAEDQLKEAKQQIQEVSTMHTKVVEQSVASHKEFEKQDWSRGVQDNLVPEKAKYEAVLSERNKLFRVIKDQQHKIHHLQQKLRRQQQSVHEDRGSSEQTKGSTGLEQKVQELRVKLQELLEKLQLEKQKVSSLELELSSVRSKYVNQIQQLEENVQQIRHTEGKHSQETLRRIEKEIMSFSEMLKTQLNEKERELSNFSVDQNERIWQLQMDKQELELKLKLAREAMNEYVIKLNEKIKDMERGESPSDVMIQELNTRNSHLKATLKALEQEQLKSQFQSAELVQQKAELQSLIGKLCPAEDAITCSSLSASPRLHLTAKNPMMGGESGKAYMSGDSVWRHDCLALKDPQHQGLKEKDYSFVRDHNHEHWSGNSTTGEPYMKTRLGTDTSFADGHYSSQARSRQFSSERHGERKDFSSVLDQSHGQMSSFRTSEQTYDFTKDQPYTGNSSPSNGSLRGKTARYIYDMRQKEDKDNISNHSNPSCNTAELKTFQYSASGLDKENCYY